MGASPPCLKIIKQRKVKLGILCGLALLSVGLAIPFGMTGMWKRANVVPSETVKTTREGTKYVHIVDVKPISASETMTVSVETASAQKPEKVYVWPNAQFKYRMVDKSKGYEKIPHNDFEIAFWTFLALTSSMLLYWLNWEGTADVVNSDFT